MADGNESAGARAARPLRTVSAVDALVAAIRDAIFAGELSPGQRLREQPTAEAYGVARHTLRAALRRLEADGMVRIERNRGASVATLDATQLTELFELRVALEVEAARLALEHHGGRLPEDVHRAAEALGSVARRPSVRWAEVGAAHDELHRAIVAASGSPRIVAAYASLSDELRLFVLQLQYAQRADRTATWSAERMADDHRALVVALEEQGPEALRVHVAEGRRSLVGQIDAGMGGGPTG